MGIDRLCTPTFKGGPGLLDVDDFAYSLRKNYSTYLLNLDEKDPIKLIAASIAYRHDGPDALISWNPQSTPCWKDIFETFEGVLFFHDYRIGDTFRSWNYADNFNDITRTVDDLKDPNKIVFHNGDSSSDIYSCDTYPTDRPWENCSGISLTDNPEAKPIPLQKCKARTFRKTPSDIRLTSSQSRRYGNGDSGRKKLMEDIAKSKHLHPKTNDFWFDVCHNTLKVLWYNMDDVCMCCGNMHSSAHWRMGGCFMIEKILNNDITNSAITATHITWILHCALKHDLSKTRVAQRLPGLDAVNRKKILQIFQELKNDPP